MMMPKMVKNSQSSARQKKTMPMAMKAIAKPCGSSRLNFSIFDSLTVVMFEMPGVTRSADFTSQSLASPLLAMRANDWSSLRTGTVMESISCVALPL